MQVTLRQDIEELGVRGETVKVPAGVARDYLLPQGLAVPATGPNIKSHQASTQQGALKLAAETTFGDPRAAEEWMHEPIPSLGGRKPVEMILGSADDKKTRVLDSGPH